MKPHNQCAPHSSRRTANFSKRRFLDQRNFNTLNAARLCRFFLTTVWVVSHFVQRCRRIHRGHFRQRVQSLHKSFWCALLKCFVFEQNIEKQQASGRCMQQMHVIVKLFNRGSLSSRSFIEMHQRVVSCSHHETYGENSSRNHVNRSLQHSPHSVMRNSQLQHTQTEISSNDEIRLHCEKYKLSAKDIIRSVWTRWMKLELSI
mmetsp:Transcript_13018/g.23411  ORF Transcript_13018/g.23411 Transcript_13018/m.23411 type:complete len:203 (-) Transcript_13018:211-819(-)